MTIPERTPLAVDHGLNRKRITALVELYDTGTTGAHPQTLKSLRSKGLVGGSPDKSYLTEHGKEVAQGLIELDDAAKEDDTRAELSSAEVDELTTFVTAPRGYVSYETEPVEVAHHPLEHPQSLTAAFQVLCRGRRSGEHSQLIAVVVGSESDAQRVADQWNLAHLADIAARSDATFAVAVPAEVGVYLFERFAVVEH